MTGIPFWIYLVIIVIGIAVLIGILRFIKRIFFKFLLALILILICIGVIFFLADILGAI